MMIRTAPGFVFPRVVSAPATAPTPIEFVTPVPQQPSQLEAPQPFTGQNWLPVVANPIATPAPPTSYGIVPTTSPAPTQTTQPSSQPSTVQATTPSGTQVAVAAPPPATYPTDELYTDPAGNTWAYNVQNGQWQIQTASTGGPGTSPWSQVMNWLQQQSTILSFTLPNYVWAAGAGAFALMIFHSGSGGHRRR